MSKFTLYTGDEDRLHVPENEQCLVALAEYDPRDPMSLQRAREAVRKHFSLTYLPVLCNEPEPGLFERLVNALSRHLRASREKCLAPSN